MRLRGLLPSAHLRRAGYPVAIVRPDDKRTFDCVVFQKAYSKRDLALARRLADRGAKVIFDLCDNHFYNPAADPAVAQRAERLRQMVDLCSAVTTPSPELAATVAPKPTFLVDDALDVPLDSRWARVRAVAAARRPGAGRRVGLVWFGNSGSENPPFGLVHLAEVIPELEELHRRTPIALGVITNSRQAFDRHIAGAPFPTECVEWRRRSFARKFQPHDVCILPVGLNPFTTCKSNNRLVMSLMLGVPVVATELPSYSPFKPWVLFGDWAESIETYAQDRALAARHVRGAQDFVRATFTPAHVVEQWSRAFAAVTDGRVAPAPPRPEQIDAIAHDFRRD